ncbi:hypothetical protein [Chryseobacterium sp. MFBS3-17]|uniref:hypothetical protein n=1 Tax=Chryseobacterium sp. MFBS3-17 TaxID=2886689 RepID=UPI001D0DE7D8|nr:hypothetical protein [Chryseobacterium sp. MFBS3-17]MCC2590266.1 hypothetical protein [Chryseobacterium sp. MFBS3-17]
MSSTNEEHSYLPVHPDYLEVMEEQVAREQSGKIFYFDESGKVADAAGTAVALKNMAGEGVFVMLDSGARVRVDRIITMFGKPGAAFDEYDAYANACMDCLGGYEKEDL